MECGGSTCELCSGSCSCNSSNKNNGNSSSSTLPSSSWRAKVCCKCRELPAQVAANQTEALCGSCLGASLFSKFKTAINTNDLILPTDKVLLAFSGGPASRVALEFLLEIREKAQRDAFHRHDGSVRVFGFGVTYVDEGCVLPLNQPNSETLVQELTKIVMDGKWRPDEFFTTSLERVYRESTAKSNDAADWHDQKRTLQLLMQNVTDPTGKEDLLEHLRMQVLQQVANLHGYTKLVLGVSTSRIAAKVIASTAKGRGFSLPAEIQYYDARWSVPVVLPLRDCVMKELVLLCHFRRLKTVFIPTFSTLRMPQKSINSLSASFVSLLQEDNPSRDRTIMRTAAKLQPFSFNHLSSYGTTLPTKKSNSLQGSNGITCCEGKGVELLCWICFAPVDEEGCNYFETWKATKSPQGLTSLLDPSVISVLKRCCSSCRFQIFGGSNPDETCDLLPQSMKESRMVNPKIKEMWMRSQISDCLLSNDEFDE